MIAEYLARQSARADPGSERVLLRIPKASAYHNGGQLHFGPDGYLYVGIGEDIAKGDAQNAGSLLGKILRLDVDKPPPYGIPDDNPFVRVPGARAEIWAKGLRNPWRFSFDRTTGDLYVADVGGNFWEEINWQPASSRGGENYGWPLMEGPECHGVPKRCRSRN